MKGIYSQPRSPYYWLRYYDKTIEIASKRRKSVCTKIPITDRDLKEIAKAKAENRKPNLIGNKALTSIVKQIKNEIILKNIEDAVDIVLPRSLFFIEAFNRMISQRTIPNTKTYIKPGTVLIYKQAKQHLIEACDNLPLHEYGPDEYNDLIRRLNDKECSRAYISMMTRTLHTCFNYFIKNKWCQVNPIEVTQSTESAPVVIPQKDIDTILAPLKSSKFTHNYYFVKFLQLTGCRPSSAMVQRIQDIDFQAKVIRITNVKTSLTKEAESYPFPLYTELNELLTEIIAYNTANAVKYPNPTNRLFPQFAFNEHHYNESLKFFSRAIRFLMGTPVQKKGAKNKRKIERPQLISRVYSLKHFRSTFVTNLIKNPKFKDLAVSRLVDHADLKTTRKHYYYFDVDNAREIFEDTKGKG
jgi:integrase